MEPKLTDWTAFYKQQCDLADVWLDWQRRVHARYLRRFGERLAAREEERKKQRGVRFYFKEQDS